MDGTCGGPTARAAVRHPRCHVGGLGGTRCHYGKVTTHKGGLGFHWVKSSRGTAPSLQQRIPKLNCCARDGFGSQPELGGGVVFPGGMDPDVGADGGQGAVPGLVGDGSVGCAAQVRVGDEPGPQAVG